LDQLHFDIRFLSVQVHFQRLYEQHYLADLPKPFDVALFHHGSVFENMKCPEYFDEEGVAELIFEKSADVIRLSKVP